MTAPLIRVEHASKKFCRSLKRSLWYGLRDLGREVVGSDNADRAALRRDEFWAVEEVGFELYRGECLGLIGHNGAGKTTLLRMLNGLIRPDRGRIEIRGRVGALIALGAGFSPVLTGRENIYVNAAVMGLDRQQVDARIDEIIDFAEIGEFIDSPVQNYSSGMSVRLGFSVAALLCEPDVLFLDEVLAVGDIGFTVKCLNRLRQLARHSAVILVSHNMQHISSFCTRVMVLEKGRVVLDTPEPALAIGRYYDMVRHECQVSGSGDAEVLGLELQAGAADGTAAILQGSTARVTLQLRIDLASAGAEVLLYIHDETMAPLLCLPVEDAGGSPLRLPPGRHTLDISLGRIELNAGKYSFVVAVRDPDTHSIFARVQGLHPFRVFSEHTYWGKIVRPARSAPKP